MGRSACAIKIEKKRAREWPQFDKEAFRQRFPFWDECELDNSAAHSVIRAIDSRIEELSEMQAKLGDARRAMTVATDHNAMVAARYKVHG